MRVGLVDSEPEIWRLLELRSSLTLGGVHRILQVAFGWEGAPASIQTERPVTTITEMYSR